MLIIGGCHLPSTFFTPSHRLKFSCSVELGRVCCKTSINHSDKSKAKATKQKEPGAQATVWSRTKLPPRPLTNSVSDVREKAFHLFKPLLLLSNCNSQTNTLKNKLARRFSESLKVQLDARQFVLLCGRKYAFKEALYMH